jgi:hypothetical protein
MSESDLQTSARVNLDDHQIRWVVVRLAIWMSPPMISKLFKEEFRRELSRQAIWRWDASPSKGHRERLLQSHPDLVELFDQSRAYFREHIDDIPIANQAVRIREIDELYWKAKDSKRPRLPQLQNLLEQAAKESGGVFTSKQQIEHSGTVGVEDPLSDDERVERVIAILDRARARRSGPAAAGSG